ncbi:unnamed protein product [Closterium sp. Naga37s-1]|nr:unnamed protein product [Closterium sp. Naga37s-1]
MHIVTVSSLCPSFWHSSPLHCLLPSPVVERLAPFCSHPTGVEGSLLSTGAAAAACHLLSPRPSLAALLIAPPFGTSSEAPRSQHTCTSRRTPCIGLAPSAMARMTALSVPLPGLLVALLTAAIASIAVVRIIMPLGREAFCRAPVTDDLPHDTGSHEVNNPLMLPSASLPHDNATVTCENATCGPDSQANAANAITASLRHAHAHNTPIHSVHTMSPGAIHLLVLYFAICTVGTLLWGMGVTHTQVRAWVHQQGLAVTAGLMKLKSATKCLLPRGSFSLQHSPIKCAYSRMQRVDLRELRGEGRQGEDEMRAELAREREERRREMQEVERRRAADLTEMRRQVEVRERELRAVRIEVNAVKGEVSAVKGEVTAMKGEVAGAEREMAEQKQSTALQLEEVERRRVAEMRGQVEESERELAAVKKELAEHRSLLMKMDVDLQIRESEGDRKTAWEGTEEGRGGKGSEE